MTLRVASFVVVAAIVFLASCGRADLSRAGAQRAIESHIRENVKPAVKSLVLGESTFDQNYTVDTVNDGELKRFRDSGYVNVELTAQARMFSMVWTHYRTSPTEKLRPFIVNSEPASAQYQIAVNIGGDVDKVTVTGLAKQSPNQVATEFTYETKFNDVGQKLFRKPAVQKSRATALFIQYDDGWRLSGISTDQSGF